MASADLIAADLIDSNPNVYYELGLAHALGKPVALLAQEMYAEQLELVQRALKAIVRSQDPQSEEEQEQLRQFLDELASVENER